ncbi:MAG: serine/threonine-protein kinase [Fimbriiglobus sp.]
MTADWARPILASKLFSAEELTVLLPQAPASLSEALAELLKKRKLTPFQAERIERGQPQGLVIADYRILTPIARGGMGMVYLGEQPGKFFAVKILPPTRAKAEPRMLTRFQREIMIGLKVPRHPQVVETFSGGEADGLHYLALEFVPGMTLKEHVEKNGTLSVGEAARLFVGIAEGLQVIHDAGVVHRDLKPGNILLQPNGQGKILDFGLALILGEEQPADPSILGGPGYTLGTMDFLPPEQSVDATQATPASDLYALGCTIYYAITGEVPYPGGSAIEKIRKHRNDSIPDMHYHNPTVPIEFDRIVAWLMAKRPESRPKSGTATADLLRPYAEPKPKQAIKLTRQGILDQFEALRQSRKEMREDSTDQTPILPTPEAPAKPNKLGRILLAFAILMTLGFALGFALAKLE